MAETRSEQIIDHLHDAAKEPIVSQKAMLQRILDLVGQARTEMNEGFTRILTAIETILSAL